MWCYASALPNQHHQWRSSLCRLSQRRMAMRAASWAWARSWPSSTNCPCLGGREPGLLTGPQRDEGKRGLGTARSPSLWRRSVWWVESNRTINGKQMYLELHRPEKGQEWLLIARLICCLSSLLACCPLSKSIIDLLYLLFFFKLSLHLFSSRKALFSFLPSVCPLICPTDSRPRLSTWNPVRYVFHSPHQTLALDSENLVRLNRNHSATTLSQA